MDIGLDLSGVNCQQDQLIRGLCFGTKVPCIQIDIHIYVCHCPN